MRPADASLSIISQNKVMRQIIQRVDKVACSDSSVLLVGETGVGKEIFAEYIHKTSHRSHAPLIKVSLSSIPHELLSSELFGYEKGAFTGARESKKGLLESASKGTIFLDDIDDVPLDMQVKLLRFLESMSIRRVGGVKQIAVDVRVISASKIPLESMVERKTFRDDLFYRLNVVPVIIPPLRERVDDIPLLIEHFLNYYAPEKSLTIHPEAYNACLEYSWPGNVRQLRNVIHRMTLFADRQIRLSDLPAEIHPINPMEEVVKKCQVCFSNGSISFTDVVTCLENSLIKMALQKNDGNQSKAAEMLGLRLSTFRDKLKKYQELRSNCDGLLMESSSSVEEKSYRERE